MNCLLQGYSQFCISKTARPPEFILCVGDDIPDEYMFHSLYGKFFLHPYHILSHVLNSGISFVEYSEEKKALYPLEVNPKDIITVTVGRKASCAKYYVNNVEEVKSVLSIV